jgi:hypothetical protein
VEIAPRFEGPPGFANGGYACGIAASGMGGTVEVTLRKPIPVGRPFERRDGKLILDGEVLAEARSVAPLDLPLPDPISPSDAAEASRRYAGFHAHAFPRCFVCGPARDDGLRLFTGPIDGRVASPWTPDHTQAGPECVWAALDCPTYWGALFGQEPRMALLGRLTAEIRGEVRVGEPHVVVGWPLGVDGRKLHGGAAIFDASGRWVARSKAVWIELAR